MTEPTTNTGELLAQGRVKELVRRHFKKVVAGTGGLTAILCWMLIEERAESKRLQQVVENVREQQRNFLLEVINARLSPEEDLDRTLDMGAERFNEQVAVEGYVPTRVSAPNSPGAIQLPAPVDQWGKGK